MDDVTWCRFVRARTRWTVDESRCTIEVPVPDRPFAWLRGSGPDYEAAVQAARRAYADYTSEPPTRPHERPSGS